MSSPTAVAFRALVMLVCLVAVPLVAVFNAPLREWLHKQIDAYKAVADNHVPLTAGPAPLFNDGNASSYRAAPQVAGGNPATSGVAQPQNNFGSASMNGPAVGGLNAANPPIGSSYTPMAGGATDRTSSAPQFPVSQASFQQPAAAPRNSAAEFGLPAATEPMRRTSPFGENGAAPVAGNLSAASVAAKTPPPNPDSFKQIERKIQDLGATYYRLETFGNEPDPYRFYCMVSMAGDPNHSRVFQARDSDPLRAMEKVLHDVESIRR